jgi:hypothetical protein
MLRFHVSGQRQSEGDKVSIISLEAIYPVHDLLWSKDQEDSKS